MLKGDGSIELIDYGGEATAISYFQELLEIFFLPEEPYSPVGWSKCGSCGYNDLCMSRAYESHSVALLPDIDQGLARQLKDLGILTIKDLMARYNETSLAGLKRPWGAGEQKVGKRATGILLQAKAMLENKEIVLKKPDIPVSKNYVMFDLEGLPPQLDELDKIYLWGTQVFGEKPSDFRYSLAEMGTGGDKKGWEDFLKIAGKIFDEYGDIPFMHWANYEKTKVREETLGSNLKNTLYKEGAGRVAPSEFNSNQISVRNRFALVFLLHEFLNGQDGRKALREFHLPESQRFPASLID